MMFSQIWSAFTSAFRSSLRRRGSIVIGMVTSGDIPTATPKKPGGVTPTMVNGCPSIRSVRPIAPDPR